MNVTLNDALLREEGEDILLSLTRWWWQTTICCQSDDDGVVLDNIIITRGGGVGGWMNGWEEGESAQSDFDTRNGISMLRSFMDTLIL